VQKAPDNQPLVVTATVTAGELRSYAESVGLSLSDQSEEGLVRALADQVLAAEREVHGLAAEVAPVDAGVLNRFAPAVDELVSEAYPDLTEVGRPLARKEVRDAFVQRKEQKPWPDARWWVRLLPAQEGKPHVPVGARARTPARAPRRLVRRVAFLDLRTSETKLFCSLHCAGATPKDLKEDGLVTRVQIPRGWACCGACGKAMV
jgi:hypothetical protein